MTSEPFGRIPFWIADSGCLANLSPAATKVLICVLAHANAAGTAHPSQARLARLSGLDVRSVRRGVKSLAAAGILRVEPGGGRGRSAVYSIAENPDTSVRDSSTQTRTPLSGIHNKKRTSASGITATKADTAVQKPGPGCPPNREENTGYKRGHQKSAAAPPASESSELFELKGEEPKPDSDGLNVGELVALWAKGHKARTSSPLAKSARGRVAGTLKRLAGEVDFEQLRAAVGRWFGADRDSYSVGLFSRKVEDGDADLTGRRVAPTNPQRQASRPANFAAAAPGVTYNDLAERY